MQPLDKSINILGISKTATLTELKAAYRKKVLAYSSSATGAAKLEEITAAYVEVVEDHQQRALGQGSEDPAAAETLLRCEELLPGQVKLKASTLTIKIKQSGSVWKRVIKEKYPSAVTSQPKKANKEAGKKGAKAKEAPIGNKFSTTWRPQGDYIHLKIVLTVQESALQVSGSSYILWAAEHYAAFNKLADELAAKEAQQAVQEEEEEVPDNDSEKMDEIIKCIRAMKGEIDHITSKIETLEMNQEAAHTENMGTHQRLDDITVKVKEIRQLTGVSAKIQTERDQKNAERKPGQPEEQAGRTSPNKSPDRKKSKAPPGSPKKTSSQGSPVKKRSTGSKQQKNRLEEDSGYIERNSSEIIRRMEEEDDDKIEEMIDDISTNEMFGSSILSNGEGDN